MRFMRFEKDGHVGIAVDAGHGWHARLDDDAAFPGDVGLIAMLAPGNRDVLVEHLHKGAAVDMDHVRFLPPCARPGKIVCLGLNYRDHAREFDSPPPKYPTLFGRFASSLIGHGAPLVRPRVSDKFDYEGELVLVIGRSGRHITQQDALDHVFGYGVFNDASIRDYQLRTTQWTMGKNFDGTGAFGPWLVTADELPPGAAGLALETRLNGEVVQQASTSDMIFDVAQTIAIVSEAMTLDAGDMIVMGTPSGVGYARKPPLYMKPGDVCEVSIERIATLRNTVVQEA
ncbi:fumarylacetoacetate hydrolase family protein [Dyella sp. C11]|uniref:fumarylacetoacetate hydrolase family protein n=1 Tax=Dyella sp. C11 TaxID=2126991 RepID=UPI000D65761D|nr:fumarylacetoacetate hydrolase family protein [Dyella sp. C11]